MYKNKGYMILELKTRLEKVVYLMGVKYINQFIKAECLPLTQTYLHCYEIEEDACNFFCLYHPVEHKQKTFSSFVSQFTFTDFNVCYLLMSC